TVLPSKHFSTHQLHDMLGQDAAYQRQLRSMRGIVEQDQLRGFPAAEKRFAGLAAKSRWDDRRDHRAALPHRGASLVGRRHLRRERRFEAELADQLARNQAVVFHDDSNRNATALCPTCSSLKQKAEERRHRDRKHEADNHRASVREKHLKVLPDQCPQDANAHGSRKLRPVSDRKTASRSARSLTTW